MVHAHAKAAPLFGVFTPGLGVQFIVVFLFLLVVYLMITRAKAGKTIRAIRKIPGLEAVDEAIGRATEMGRPVHITSGLGGIGNPETFAFYGVLSHVARQAAKYDVRLINTNADQFVLAVNTEIIRQGYLEANRPHAFNSEDVRFESPQQFPYAAALAGLFARERPAANIMVGLFAAEAVLLAESGYEAGAVQIGGTADDSQIPFFLAACDYTLIGEEIYAASAYLSKEPVLSGSVVGEDWGKLVIFVVIVAGSILATLGVAQPLIQLLHT